MAAAEPELFFSLKIEVSNLPPLIKDKLSKKQPDANKVFNIFACLDFSNKIICLRFVTKNAALLGLSLSVLSKWLCLNLA